MKITFLTATYNRPLLLERLSFSIIPVLLKFKGNIKWRIYIDGDDSEYLSVKKTIYDQLDNKDLVIFSSQKNIGKFQTLIKGLNEEKENKCDWVINIDDDDLLIDYKFISVIKNLDKVEKNTLAIIFPRLILNRRFYSLNRIIKNRLFIKYHNHKLSYFEFKKKIGDYDTTIFINMSYYSFTLDDELSNENFTAESLLYLGSFKNAKLLFLNENIVYSQYLSLGLSQKSRFNRIKNPLSSATIYKEFVISGKSFSNSFFFYKCLINFYRFKFHTNNVQYTDQLNIEEINIFILKKIICKVFGKAFFYIDKVILKINK